MSWDEPGGAKDESARVRGLVVEAFDAAAELIAGGEVAARWDEPSALSGMTVDALAAHLVRAAGATLAYLDRTDPTARPDGALLTPVTYSQAAIDSPIHERITEVSALEAAAGPDELVAHCARVASEMRIRLAAEPEERIPAGHIGLIISHTASKITLPALVDWLTSDLEGAS